MERLTRHNDFVKVLRLRGKVSSRDIVMHFLVHEHPVEEPQTSLTPDRRLGLAVSKNVGNAVVRNRVKRRFRALASEHETLLPENCDIVIRAKPSAATAQFASLDKQVVRLFDDISQKNESDAD